MWEGKIRTKYFKLFAFNELLVRGGGDTFNI